MSCRSILKKLLFKGAITQKEYDKIERNLKTEAETQDEALNAVANIANATTIIADTAEVLQQSIILAWEKVVRQLQQMAKEMRDE